MSKYLRNRAFLFTVVTGLFATCIAWWLLHDIETTPAIDTSVEGYYTFNPESILKSLDQSNADIFERQSIDFEPTIITPDVTVQWNQANYFQIASALHANILDEPIADRNLHFMIFRAGCEQMDEGPQQAVFEFYRITQPFFQKKGYKETINIDPATNSIWFQNERLSSREIYSQSINLLQLKVSANDAFRIAEDNGGRKARLELENDCSVSAILAPDGSAQNWEVNYSNRDSAHIFDIIIDEYTGEYEVIHP